VSTTSLSARRRLATSAAGGSALLTWIERHAGVTASGVLGVGVVVCGWFVARLVGNRGMFLLVYGVLLVLVAAALLGRRRLSVDASRSAISRRVREGQVLGVDLELTARRRLSTVVLEEALSPVLGTTVRVPVASLAPGESLQHRYTFVPRRRGRYQVGPLVAEWSDPLGLTVRRTVLAEPVEIIVHPSTELAQDRIVSREWEDPPIRPPVTKPWPSGFEFYGMREYVSGDDPRRIVWRAVAQHGKYLVREAEQGITDRVNLFLDTHRERHAGADPSPTFETAVRVVASLGAKHLHDGLSVSVDVNSARLATALRGRRHELTLLDELAVVETENAPLSAALERLLGESRRNSHNVIVTPHVDRAAASRLRLLRDRGVSILLVLIISEDTDPAALHRAAGLGCNIVEITPGPSIGQAFRRVVGAVR
jgi:uncharacterized protein (DUF58 family)